jgi:hypothetical protein
MNVIECGVTSVDIDVQHSQIIVLEHRRMTFTTSVETA